MKKPKSFKFCKSNFGWILTFLFFLTQNVFSQSGKLPINLAYEEVESASEYKIIRTSWKAFDDISYIAPAPYTNSIGARKVPLRETEKSYGNFQFLEACIPLKYTIASGRESSKGIWRRMRTTLNYTPVFRMLANDSSSNPVTPLNHDIGLGVDINLFATNKGFILCDGKRFDDSYEPKNTYKMVNLHLSMAHYSNGQSSGSTYTDPAGNTRNDYAKGDFSTGYFRAYINFGFYKYNVDTNLNFSQHKHLLAQFALGYQRDVDYIGGFLENQENSYGKHRLLLKVDFRLGPQRFHKINNRHELWQKNYHATATTKTTVPRIFDQHLSLKSYLILDKNLDLFRPNLQNSNGKYPIGIELIWEVVFYRFRTLGFFTKFYCGRDYLNIRYDDIVFIGMAGITASLSKYRAPLWQSGHAQK